MEIKILYKTINSEEYQEKELLPEDFFDELDEDDNEKGFHYLSMYKHLYEPWLYSGKNKNELVHFSFSINDKNGCIESNYTFWNEGKCWIESYKEINFHTKNQHQTINVNVNENIVKDKLEKNTLLNFKQGDHNFLQPMLHNVNISDNKGEEIDTFIETGFKN